jgi:hypothetical protein
VLSTVKSVGDTGRIIRDDKRGAISALNVSSAKLLTRLNIPQDNWLKLTTEFGKLFHGPVGTLQELTRYCEHLEKRRRHFSSCCQHKSGLIPKFCNSHFFPINLTNNCVEALWLKIAIFKGHQFI